jgi:hypothetical protein
MFCAVTFSVAIRPKFIRWELSMDTNKAGYWIALGVLALGLNSEYRHGKFVTLHKVVDQSGSVAFRITARVEETLAVATGRVSWDQSAAANLLASADASTFLRDRSEILRERAQDEADFVREQVRAQTEMIRARAEMRRAAIEQMRSLSRIRVASGPGSVKVICPKLGTRIVVNSGLDLRDVSTDVDISENF